MSGRLSDRLTSQQRAAVQAAQRAYLKTHWGHEGDGPLVSVERCADPNDDLTRLGLLAEVTYVTSKRGDPPNTHYVHAFNFKKPPVLAFNEEGLLVIAGGSYRVTERGIVG